MGFACAVALQCFFLEVVSPGHEIRLGERRIFRTDEITHGILFVASSYATHENYFFHLGRNIRSLDVCDVLARSEQSVEEIRERFIVTGRLRVVNSKFAFPVKEKFGLAQAREKISKLAFG